MSEECSWGKLEHCLMEQQEKLKGDKLSLKVPVPGMASVKVGYVL